MTSSLGVLLEGLVDYAGLFPPAALGLPDVVRRFAAYRAGPHRRMLGRLVIPAQQLDAFEAALAGEVELADGHDPWRVSLLATAPYGETVRRIWDFNGRHGADGQRDAVIDSVEVKAREAAEVEAAADVIPAGFELYVEAPPVNVPVGFFDAVARSGARAKLRTGGTAPDQIPPPLALAAAIEACHRAGLSFKATAGLHHPLRSDRPLTYDRSAPHAVVHGFLNVLVAAAAIEAQWVDAMGAAEILAESAPGAFQFTDESLAWRTHRLTLAELRAARRFFRSFGSCSFDEPVEGLKELALL